MQLFTRVSVGYDPCCDVCLDEAIDHNTISQHHTMIRLPSDQDCQAAAVAVRISGINILCCDDHFFSFGTLENWFQASDYYRDLIIDGRHLTETKSWIGKGPFKSDLSSFLHIP